MALNGVIAALEKRKKMRKREEEQEECLRKLENEVKKLKKSYTEKLIKVSS